MIHGVAVDAGSGLAEQIRVARGKSAQVDDLLTFKRAVIKTLGQGASMLLIDSTLGPQLLGEYPKTCEPIMAYEADVYRISEPDRMTVVPDDMQVADFAKMGMKHLKFFIYYAPNDDPELNRAKQNLVAEVGNACANEGLKFLMEPLVYDRQISAGSADFARIKPELVRRATEVFASPRFKADVLKVEIPLDMAFVEGIGEPLISKEDALAAFADAGRAAGDISLVYLSAGVSFDFFETSLKLAKEAGVDFSGFMCGRALWSDAIEVFGSRGEDALYAWLKTVGISRLERLIAALK